MSRILRLALPAALLALVVTATAAAQRPVMPEKLTTPHFQVHFTGDPSDSGRITYQQAGDVAGHAERAYTALTSEWGYAAPLNDGDGKIDFYVMDISELGAVGFAITDTAASQAPGYVILDESAVNLPDTVMHELFHLSQFAVWAPAEGWLLESTAEWAGFRFLNFPSMLTAPLGGQYPLAITLGAPDMSLTCAGDACGNDDYERGGYSRWTFFQYLSERFGYSTVKEIFERGRTLNNVGLGGIDLVGSVLASKGSTLSDAFTDWTVANMSGAYAAEGLKGLLPPTYSSTHAGAKSGALPTQKVPVNHLATRYLSFRRGDGVSTGPCYAATLTLNVALPAGVGARPFFRWTEPGSTPIPLAISGGNATLSVPWDTCSWSYEGLLALPNSSTTVDAALFSVSGSLNVDTKKIVTPTGPPVGPYKGPTIPAPVSDEPPAIALFGPEVLRVSKKTRVIRLIVFSSGRGTLDAKLGELSLGSRTLRTGNNDLRFTLPASVMRTLTARGELRLTSLSPSGQVGATVTRRITITK